MKSNITKVCVQCKKEKGGGAFVLLGNGRYLDKCKACARAAASEIQAAHNLSREIAEEERRKKNEKGRIWRENNKEHSRRHKAWVRYGLSESEHEDLIKCCAICGATDRLVIDHDHATGQVRGILCHKHNLGLGLFGDDQGLLIRAVYYLMGTITTRTSEAIREKLGVH